MEYAIVDIETTGGYASGSGITEIAICIHDGQSVIERYETLINPLREIPLAIQSLTGIDEQLVQHSPSFDKVAAQIYALLEGRVFVAHNVNFDYSFVQHHLAEAGYSFKAPKLCTVRLSRKIKPGLPSYSLGKLCSSLGIPISNRHRAGGDADATAILFGQLLAWDSEDHKTTMLKKASKEQNLPPHLDKQQFEALPEAPGVYYFKDKAGQVIYVGKAVNIRKRVLTHFTGNNPQAQRQHFLREIHKIDFEQCGTELMALLLEASEIKRLWPKYNRALKKFEAQFALYRYEDRRGLLRLAIGPSNKKHIALFEFNSRIEASNALHRIMSGFGLCPALCGLDACAGDCQQAQLHHATANECLSVAAINDYNHLVNNALLQFQQQLPSFILLDKGRHTEEQSCIWLTQGLLYAMGYVDKNTDLHRSEDILSSLNRYKSDYYSTQLVLHYAQKHPSKIIPISLDPQHDKAETS